MTEYLLDAITKQLGTTFGNDYHYYVEDVKQNLTKPCFTVDTLLSTQRSKSPVLYDRTVSIVVHYFSDSTTTLKKDCYSVNERLIECLEYLPFNNTLLRGEDISYQIEDDMLIVFTTYKFTTQKVVDAVDSIETYEGVTTRVQ